MAYNGKRVYDGGSRRSDSSRRRSHSGGMGQLLLRVMFFPVLFIYLELVLHIHMKTSMAYALIFMIFALAGGFVLSALTLPWRRNVNGIVAKVLTWVFCVVYAVEIIAKTILQTYYPLSSLGTAAGNKLTDYADVIVSTVLSKLPIILILLLPAILITALGRRLLGFARMGVPFAGVVLAAALIFHVIGLGVVHLPWKGDLTPKMLYNMGTNYDDQVEQLGMLNMLRLDVKHMIFPPDNTPTGDFEGIGDLGGDGSSSGGDPSGSTSEPIEEPVDTSPNVMDVDLAGLAASTSSKDVKWLAEYFNSVTPTRKNEYTGMFEGYNVIFFTLEGFSGYAIDKDLTPTLYKLTHEGFVFNNFYTPLHFTSTSGGEWQNLMGMYPRNGFPISMTESGKQSMNTYFNLAQQLGKEGYLVQGYHANGNMYGRDLSHPNLGYDWRQFGMGFDNLELNSSGTKPLWPQRDKHTIEASIDNYINSPDPFHVYYLTISGHMPYSNNRVVQQYRDILDPLPYSDTTKNYLGTVIEVDRALEYLIQRLDQAGKLENTLIVAAPDHIPYFDLDTLDELAGRDFGGSQALADSLNEDGVDTDLYKSSLIIWSASMEEPVQVDKVVGQVDILPTVSNLLGLEYDSRMLDGTDALSDSEGLVIFNSRSWRSDRGFYNSEDQTFDPAPGVTMTKEEQDSYVAAMKKLVRYKIDSTHMVITTDFFSQVFGEDSKWVNPVYRK